MMLEILLSRLSMSPRQTRVAAATLAMAALIVGCTESATPGSDAASAPPADAESVFREFNDAVNTGDAAAAAALVADDAVFYGERAADLGIDGVVASLACATDIKSADVEGDTVTVELEFTGRAPLTVAEDCPVGTTQSALVTVRDGKIVELTDAD